MAKKISQETFDDVVRENIEDFGLSDADALRDSIEQFVKQGVSLTNIDISGGIGRQEMLDAIDELKAITARNGDSAKILSSVDKIKNLCGKANELYLRNQMLLNDKGGLNSLHLLFDVKQEDKVLLAVMTLLNELSKANEDIRDFFEPGGSSRLVAVLKRAVLMQDLDVITGALTLARTVNRSENNKNMLMRSGVGEVLVALLNSHVADHHSSAAPAAEGDHSESSVIARHQMIQEACSLVRGLCVHDDTRKDMSCAYDNGKFFIKQDGFVQTLTRLAADFRAQPDIASAALHAARNLITTEESVKVVTQHGAIELITDILRFEGSSLSLARSAVGLMRNVCADDIRKDRLVVDGTLDLLLCAMGREVYACDASFMEHALACLAAMSLRSPSNSERIVANGMSMDIVVRSMRRHADKPALQRQGCLTIRNIAGRCPHLRQQLLDAGVEPVLRAAGRLSGVVDEAYAALRDLEVEVTFVKIGEDGQVQPAYETFGGAAAAGGKLRFNPVYDDDTSYIEQRVQEEARAPLQAENTRSDDHVFTEAASGAGCCGGAHDHAPAAGGASHSHDHDHKHDCC